MEEIIYETEGNQGIDGSTGEHPREIVLKNDLDARQRAVSIGCDYQGLIAVPFLRIVITYWQEFRQNLQFLGIVFGELRKSSEMFFVKRIDKNAGTHYDIHV